MLRLLFLALVATLVAGDGMPPGCSDGRIEECIFHYYDADANGIITAAEIDAFNITAICNATLLPVHDIVNSTLVFPECDVGIDGFADTKDGVITTADFQGPFSCVRSMALCTAICIQCDQCDTFTGYVPPP